MVKSKLTEKRFPHRPSDNRKILKFGDLYQPKLEFSWHQDHPAFYPYLSRQGVKRQSLKSDKGCGIRAKIESTFVKVSKIIRANKIFETTLKVTIQFDIMITIEKPSEDSVIRIFPDFLSIFEPKKESRFIFESVYTTIRYFTCRGSYHLTVNPLELGHG